MPSPFASASVASFRYLRGWMAGGAGIHAHEVVLDVEPRAVPATLLLPLGPSEPLSAWVALHGITRPGRGHRSLQRFARALAGSGSAVLLPEVPEWRALRLAPDRTLPTLLASARFLERHPRVDPERRAAVGFSFGAPLTIASLADPELSEAFSGAVGFGGYCDLEETLHFQFTGEHRAGGPPERLSPDPYGRWVVGSNYLTRIPGLEGKGRVARAIWSLAAEAGDRDLPSWDGALDPVKDALARPLSPPDRTIFRLFAPPAAQPPDPVGAGEMGRLLLEAVHRTEPLLDPAPLLKAVRRPVHLMHGRGDQLIPYTQTLQLERVLSAVRPRVTITDLFSHSRGATGEGGLKHRSTEALRFFRALREMLALPGQTGERQASASRL